jgi:hypothetical protein
MTSRWYSANVLQANAGGRRLWHLQANNDRFAVQEETTLLLNEPCPPLVVGKDWQTLFRKKLNIAWLPADRVFFRAVQLPSSDPAELAAMVELQLEKISPLPVTHAVWSIYLLPRAPDKPEALQTVIVIIAARSMIEEYLGQLGEEGFLPDRVEAPGLEQFLAAKISGDGVWIFAGAPGEPALVVWSYGETIQNMTLVTLPAGPERGPLLKTQLEQVAWTGELDGWLPGPPKVHLLAAQADAEFWGSIFKDWGEQTQIVPPASPKELAALSAQRCAGAASTSTSLLPPEFAARYRQQFVDRLWMRGLVSVAALYIMGVLFYFGMLYVFQLKDDKVKRDLAGMGASYTNSLRDVEQIKILKDRQTLKYAALDCWKAVAENLPDSMTVETMYFQSGRLELQGSYASDDVEQVGTFNEALRTATDPNRHESLFTDVSAPTTRKSGDHGVWSFNCTIKENERQ